METPIQVLVREIKDEAESACEIYPYLNSKNKKARRECNDKYVLSIRRISELVHAIEKLNQI